MKHILLSFLDLCRKQNGGSMHPSHYALIADDILKAPAGGVLIFGPGRDTGFWMHVCENRTLLFVEDNPDWANHVRAAGAEVLLIHYETTVGVPSSTLQSIHSLGIRHSDWVAIIVDGPRGYEPDHPGRELSIAGAAEIRATTGAMVFVHDYEREWEKQCCDIHLGKPTAVVPAHGDHRLLAVWR